MYEPHVALCMPLRPKWVHFIVTLWSHFSVVVSEAAILAAACQSHCNIHDQTPLLMISAVWHTVADQQQCHCTKHESHHQHSVCLMCPDSDAQECQCSLCGTPGYRHLFWTFLQAGKSQAWSLHSLVQHYLQQTEFVTNWIFYVTLKGHWYGYCKYTCHNKRYKWKCEGQLYKKWEHISEQQFLNDNSFWDIQCQRCIWEDILKPTKEQIWKTIKIMMQTLSHSVTI